MFSHPDRDHNALDSSGIASSTVGAICFSVRLVAFHHCSPLKLPTLTSLRASLHGLSVARSMPWRTEVRTAMRGNKYHGGTNKTRSRYQWRNCTKHFPAPDHEKNKRVSCNQQSCSVTQESCTMWIRGDSLLAQSLSLSLS